MNISKNSVSIAGEFAVLSQLTLRGYDANLTLGNTKHVDILVSDSNRSGKLYRLEVKTNYGKMKPTTSKLFGHTLCSWIMGDKHEGIQDEHLFYAFVNIDPGTTDFRFFVVPNRVVAEYVKKQHELYLRSGEHAASNMRMFRLGIDDEQYSLPTPTASQWENNWEFRAISNVV